MSNVGNDLAKALAGIVGENDDRMGISQFLDTGIPELNWVLSNNFHNGFPVGRLVEVFGPPSCGKTFLATQAMAAAQKAGGIAGFSDHERTFEPHLAKSLGLNVDRGLADGWVYKRPQTFEESVDTAVAFCEKVRQSGVIADDAPLIWVFDSVASMIPHEKLFNDKGERRQAGSYNMRDSLLLAKATSQNYPVLAQFAEDNNMLVLLLNQIRQKPGVLYGDPTTVPGGQAPEFYASIRLSLGRTEITNGKKGDDKELLGYEISAKTTKNKTARVGRKARWRFRFNEGLGVTIDQIDTNVDFMVRKGLIERDGNYCVWEGKKLYQKSLVNQLRQDPDAMSKLMALLPNEELAEDALPDVVDTAATANATM